MGHPYRQRHDTPASTTTDNLTGLGAPKTTGQWSEDNTLAELQAAAKAAGQPTYGTKADILERLNT